MALDASSNSVSPVQNASPLRTTGDFKISNNAPQPSQPQAHEQAPALRRDTSLSKPDPGANPFKVVIDPDARMKLRRALFELIEYHDEALAEHFVEGKLSLESYKEYIELFARSLKETMASREGVSYLLRAAGFEVAPDEINLNPELRWKKGPAPFGSTLL